MAVELCSENPNMVMSPRISFSHDLCQSDIVPVEHLPFRSNSSGSVDFKFCVDQSFQQESSSADELFSDGKILPSEVKKKTTKSRPKQDERATKTRSEKEVCNEDKRAEVNEKQNSKSFWRFKRSSSFNCGSGYGPSLCPLPLLSRSSSTGSTSDGNNNRSITIKTAHSQPSLSTSYQKPPLKRTSGTHGNRVRVDPVLNVPPANLFGLGSLLSGNRSKNKKK